MTRANRIPTQSLSTGQNRTRRSIIKSLSALLYFGSCFGALIILIVGSAAHREFGDGMIMLLSIFTLSWCACFGIFGDS